MTCAFSAQYGFYPFTQGCANSPPWANMRSRRWSGLCETPVFLHLGIREIVTRAFLPVKSLQNLDQEWSS